MNVHILLVMKHLDDNESVTPKELSGNYKAAFAIYDTYDTYGAVDDAAADIAYVVYYAAYAAYAYADDADAKNRVDYYFSITGENRQDYLDEIAKNKGDK